MKKNLLLFASLVSVFSLCAQSTVDINGTLYPIDTTAHYQAGPGVWHTRYTVAIGTNKHHCYILEIDLTNPYNTIEEWQSSMEFGKTQKLADAHVQMSAENHRPVGGVNCNFWVVSSQNVGNIEGMLGQSFAGTARNGVMIGQPDDWNQGHGDRGYVMIDRNKKAWIEEMRFDGVLTAADATTHPIRDVNRPRVLPNPDEVTLFNHYMGSKPTRATDGIEVVFSTPEWKMNGDMTCIVTSINTAGGTLITEGNGVLQGRGSGKAFLEKFKEGDTFTINLGVVSATDATFRPDIMEMVTGNCLVMRDGVLTDRNTNEEYNNRNYPRTMLATNNEGNKFWMMVAEKPGMYTAQMCALLKHAGATYAAGMDGGGSAQMCLDGQVLNPTTEGTPRAVANSIWVLSTAPDDNIVAKITASETVIRLPKYGVYAPVFNSYNQYGVLLSQKQEGVVLSCDANTGYIDHNGHFVCLNNGTVTASYGDVTYTVEVQLVPTDKVAIRLDSVLIMDDTNYAIEVNAHAGAKELPILSAALQWEIADPTICAINEKGEVNGLTNGSTWVYGTIGGVTDSIIVNVEIPETKPYLMTDMNGIEQVWTIKTTPSSLKTEMRISEDGKAILWTNFTGGRAANTKFTINQPLYALPTYLEIKYNAQGFPISKIATEFQSNNMQEKVNVTLEEGAFSIDKPTSIIINLQEVLEQGNDIAIYPIQWNYLTFFYNLKAEKKEYNFLWDGIYLHYGKEPSITVGIDDMNALRYSIYPNPTSDQLHIRGIETQTQVTLFDLQGRTIVSSILQKDGTINITNVTAGTYVLQVGNETVKIIKQ